MNSIDFQLGKTNLGHRLWDLLTDRMEFSARNSITVTYMELVDDLTTLDSAISDEINYET
jgi:hypothetical protein